MINTLKKIYNFIILLKVPKKIKNNFSDLSEEYKRLTEIELKKITLVILKKLTI